MTDTTTSAERKAFEAWWANDSANWDQKQLAWAAWQARAASQPAQQSYTVSGGNLNTQPAHVMALNGTEPGWAELKIAAGNAGVIAEPAQEPVARAFEDCATSESFEDGVEAGLHERDITSLSAAWMAGRMDFIEEVRDTVACTTYADPLSDSARADRIKVLVDELTIARDRLRERGASTEAIDLALEREVRKP